MQVSESNKQEAEKVLKKIHKVFIKHGAEHYQNKSIELAIHNRQSVLEALEKVFEREDLRFIHEEITNLTEQIEYLKSKL